MFDLQEFATGNKGIEEILNEYGLTVGFYANYMNQTRKNIIFLRMIGIISDEEAQLMFQRLIAKMARWLDIQTL